MVTYNGVVVWCLRWWDCLFGYLRVLTDWGSELTGKWHYLRIKFYRSPMNFWSLLPTGSNFFTRHSRNLADPNCSFRHYEDFWDLCYKIPEKELPATDRHDWSMVSKGNQEQIRAHVSFYLTIVLSRFWVSGEVSKQLHARTFFLDRRSSQKSHQNSHSVHEHSNGKAIYYFFTENI